MVDGMTIPTITLNDGIIMPALGLGVYQAPPAETTAAVEAALNTGYRHINAEAVYGNEREVGAAIGRSGLDREEILESDQDLDHRLRVQRDTR